MSYCRAGGILAPKSESIARRRFLGCISRRQSIAERASRSRNRFARNVRMVAAPDEIA